MSALPPGWARIPVSGCFAAIDSSTPTGVVRFLAPRAVVVSNVVVVPTEIIATLDATGCIPTGFSLPSTDDPDILPVGWAYTVVEDFEGGRKPYMIEVPYGAAGIDLATVVPVVPVIPGAAYLTDAPHDGNLYGRKDGAWSTAGDSEITNEDVNTAIELDPGATRGALALGTAAQADTGDFVAAGAARTGRVLVLQPAAFAMDAEYVPGDMVFVIHGDQVTYYSADFPEAFSGVDPEDDTDPPHWSPVTQPVVVTGARDLSMYVIDPREFHGSNAYFEFGIEVLTGDAPTGGAYEVVFGGSLVIEITATDTTETLQGKVDVLAPGYFEAEIFGLYASLRVVEQAYQSAPTLGAVTLTGPGTYSVGITDATTGFPPGLALQSGSIYTVSAQDQTAGRVYVRGGSGDPSDWITHEISPSDVLDALSTDPGSARDALGLGSAAVADVEAFDAFGVASGYMSAHLAAPNPHPQYLLESAAAAVATSGAYSDLSGQPTLGTAAAQDVGAFATAAQGAKADAALPASTVSAFALTLLDDADAASARNTLGVGSPVRFVTFQFGIPVDGDVTEPIPIAFAGTITGYSLIAAGASSAVSVDLWRGASGAVPTVADSILSTPLSTTAYTSGDATPFASTAVAADDVLIAQVSAASDATSITLVIEVGP